MVFLSIYGIYVRSNEWSKATFHWPSRPQKSKAPVSGQYLTIYFLLLMNSSWKGFPVMVQQQPVVQQQGFRGSSTRSIRVLSMCRACKPTPLKVSRVERMQKQKQHTHTNDTRTLFTETIHAYVHAPTPACAHMCMHASLHARTYMHANLCAQMHTQTNTYVRKRYMHAWVCKPQHTHKCIRTCTYPCMPTTISKHAHTHVHAHVSMHTHAHT